MMKPTRLSTGGSTCSPSAPRRSRRTSDQAPANRSAGFDTSAIGASSGSAAGSPPPQANDRIRATGARTASNVIRMMSSWPASRAGRLVAASGQPANQSNSAGYHVAQQARHASGSTIPPDRNARNH